MFAVSKLDMRTSYRAGLTFRRYHTTAVEFLIKIFFESQKRTAK